MVCYVVYLLMANYKNVFVPLFVKLNSSAIFVFYLYAPVQPMVAAWRVQMFLCNHVYEGICHYHASSVTMQNFPMGSF